MKASLVLKMGQQLAMTPQLQQAIRLLQLSSLDLQQEIQEALDSNPMLESESEDDFEHSESHSENNEDTLSAKSDASYQEPVTHTTDTFEEDPWKEKIPSELAIDTVWEDIYQTSASSLPAPEEDWDFTAHTSSNEDLQSHLLWQLNLAPMNELDRRIAQVIIESINEQGYLDENLEDILQSLDPSWNVELDEIEVVLRRIQQFEPTGVGARSLRECLLLQLEQLPSDTEWLNEAKVLVSQHLETLGNRDFPALVRRMRLKEPELAKIVSLVQSLNPRPGAHIESSEPEYVVPDVIVRKDNERWVVELNHESLPRVRVNNQYAGFIRRADNSADNTYLRNQLQEARWFIKSLESRNETLLKVATQIVAEQLEFFEQGPEAMRPLVLQSIAEAVGMHESTISRVTTQKFMHTPRGIFELKYFFSSHVSTAEGGECSSIAIRAMIKKLVATENARKPLSDSKIAALLEEQGIQVARRTIAKYRESLGILSSSERKRLL